MLSFIIRLWSSCLGSIISCKFSNYNSHQKRSSHASTSHFSDLDISTIKKSLVLINLCRLHRVWRNAAPRRCPRYPTLPQKPPAVCSLCEQQVAVAGDAQFENPMSSTAVPFSCRWMHKLVHMKKILTQ